MKRKIAAILAADAVGYSRLVAEDEEDTLARLASYRGVFGDFVTRFGGRIFNTAGDAILAEFESAVDAVRCAVDVQESLRARNLAYTPSRQMSFRIGITIGDVVERDGDLLGDGVNVAARLESVAPDGGICISRSVYEVVANKVSLEFSDRGEQHLKNIPDPVHAYTFAPDVSSKNRKQASRLASLVTRHWTVFAAVMVVLAGIAGFMFVGREQSVQSVKPPPAPATEASLPSEVEPDVESADSSSPPAEGTPASPPAARAPQASTVSPEGTTSSGASRDIAESAAGNEPKTTKNVDVGCKKFFPAIGKTLTVPCGVDAPQGVPQSGAAPQASTVSPDGATSNGASRDTAESPAQETESSGERLTLTARLGKKTIEGQTRTVLGVRIQSLDDRLRSCFDVKEAKGAVVQEVSPESPAKDAGLQSGDIIQ